MADEHRCEQSTALALCANNCGFFGNPATLNLCSKCFRRWESENHGAKTASSPAVFSANHSQFQVQDGVVSITRGIERMTITEKAHASTTIGPDRCGACRKRVGLMGFKCRCGPATYCGSHRYPETHSCTFDFKKMGKEEIAKVNPLVRAPKLQYMI